MAESDKHGSDDDRADHYESLDFIREMVASDVAAGKADGRVQTRFPPEPNGFLHIGHAKSIFLNFGIASDFDGECFLRFDDTNPETEDSSFVEAIQEDLSWLGVAPSGPPKYASDYFEQLYDLAVSLIEKGLAYVDDQSAETISEQRGGFGQPGTESPFRDRSVEENLSLFSGMRNGESADGERVLRARIDMQSDNMWLRDPVLYRIRRITHHRTGDDWIIYPTYDWAHGQSDALEGVTHSLCTLEFADHRPLYNWCLNNLEIPGDQPEQTEFARLNITHTVLSKRILRQLVQDGVVDSWDDARMPTVRGLRRRGYPASAIAQFVDRVGVAKANSTVEIELLESFVRNELNPSAPRRMAVTEPLKVVITNWPKGQTAWLDIANHPNDPDAGVRQVPFTGELWIEREDFRLEPPPKYYRLTPGREVRLRSAFLITATDAVIDEDGDVVQVNATYDTESRGGTAPDGRKVKSTMHWVSADHAVDIRVYRYDRLFADSHPGAEGADPLESLNPDSRRVLEAKGEATLGELEPGAVVQFERLGYFANDMDDPGLFHETVGLRDEWAKIAKGK